MTKSAKKNTRPRQADLPGTDDRRVGALEQVATEYAEIRDQRMELIQQEVDLKQRALTLMKKQGRTVYKRDGIEIEIVPGEERLKVRVKKVSQEDEADSGDAPSDDAEAEA